MKINDNIFDYYGEDEGLSYTEMITVFIGVICDFLDVVLRYSFYILVVFGLIDYVEILIFNLPTQKIWFAVAFTGALWLINTYVLNYIFAKYTDCFSDD